MSGDRPTLVAPPSAPSSYVPPAVPRSATAAAAAGADVTAEGAAITRPHLPALDGVRGTAALMVMLYHYCGRLRGMGRIGSAVVGVAQFGWVGVELFFVLSGFLITGILLDTREKPDYFRSFYRRRALRIFPLYYAFVALYVFLIAPNLPGGVSTIGSRQAWLWTYLVNFDIARHGWFVANDTHANNLWSLAIEEQFYLVLPTLVLLVPRRGLKLVAAACVVGSIVGRFALAHAGLPPRTGYVLTFTRLDGLGLGVILALLYRERGQFGRLVPAARVVAPAAAAIAVALAVRYNSFDIGDWRVLRFGLPVVAFGFAALMVLVLATDGSARLRGLFESRALRFLGRYSYGLYIWHTLVGRVLRVAGFDVPSVVRVVHWNGLAEVIVVLVKIATAIATAMLSYAVIEQPFLKLKDRGRRVAAPVGGPPALTT